MKTGLKKKEKFTRIYFNESSSTVDIFTHNSALKRRPEEYFSTSSIEMEAFLCANQRIPP